MRKKDIAYFFDPEFGLYKYADGHPMKPHRVTMTDELIRKYEMMPLLKQYDSSFVTVNDDDLTQFHADEYIEFIKNVNTENKHLLADSFYRYNFGEDSPVFDGLYDFCKIYSGGSILGAKLLCEGKSDIAINWSGGLHHAKRHEASGFCYVNDCVLGILELLKTYQRVLYIDIDIHHGDGVEEAFYLTDRVMTCSFHKFGDYFPGTGHETDVGYGKGNNHAINFPLLEGIDDESYVSIFKPVLNEIRERFRPEAVVFQCGSDSISGDKLGCFNLSIRGHGECLNYVRDTFQVPMLVLGGGGYTLRNVARCWTYETSLLLNVDLPDKIPDNEFKEYFCPEYKLHIPVSNMENLNRPSELDRVKGYLFQTLQKIQESTGIQITNYPENPREPGMDIEELSRANRDKLQDQMVDEHIHPGNSVNQFAK